MIASGTRGTAKRQGDTHSSRRNAKRFSHVAARVFGNRIALSTRHNDALTTQLEHQWL